MPWFSCIKANKSKIKLIIISKCFTKKKLTFNININTKEQNEVFFDGLQKYIKQWEELESNNQY